MQNQLVLKAGTRKGIFQAIFLSFLLCSCKQKSKEYDGDTIIENNKSTTFSSDTAKLSKLIDIRTFRPTHARFKYVLIDNSGQNARLTIPGPSDSYLEAILHYDSLTFRNILKAFFPAS